MYWHNRYNTDITDIIYSYVVIYVIMVLSVIFLHTPLVLAFVSVLNIHEQAWIIHKSLA